jgi:hypothetical protein
MTVSSGASLRPAAGLAAGWSGGVFRWVTEGVSPEHGVRRRPHEYVMTIFYYVTPVRRRARSWVGAQGVVFVTMPEIIGRPGLL